MFFFLLSFFLDYQLELKAHHLLYSRVIRYLHREGNRCVRNARAKAGMWASNLETNDRDGFFLLSSFLPSIHCLS